jgi:uncharacterized membrane protein
MDGAGFFPASNMDASPPDNSPQKTGSVPIEMNAARQSVVVKAPISQVYEQWSRVENLPRFITPLRNVQRIDDTHFSYIWHPNGSEQQGVFQIVLRIPSRRIAWRSMSDGFMSGVVGFEPRSDQETEITLKIRSIFDPPRLSRRVEEYLRNFKRLVENGQAAL